MTAPICVTVDGPRASANVTLDDVRRYLTEKGWTQRRMHDAEELWMRGDEFAVTVYAGDKASGELPHTVRRLARYEQRHPADVLREIAGGPIWATATHAAAHALDMLSGQPVPRARDIIARELEYWHERGVHEGIKSEREMAARTATEKTPAERRADEIVGAPKLSSITFNDALRWARENYEASRWPSSDPKIAERNRVEAEAMLIVAQRLLAREAAR